MKKHELILVADDSPSIVKLIQVNLDFEGYETIGAFDGKEALEKVKRHKPNLIILDILMPNLDGWEVIETLKADPETAAIPVIVLTAVGKNEDRRRGLELGVSDYVTKPFNAIRLLEAVEHTLHPSPLPAPPAPQEFHPITRVAIVGESKRAHGILQTLLGNPRVEILGLATMDPRGPAAKLARELKIFLSADPYALCNLQGLDLIIETEPHSLDLTFVERANPNIEVLRGYSTNFVWSLVEEKEASEERARALVKELHTIAIEKAKLYDDLQQSKHQIEGLLSKVIYAQEEERKRIAAEIHDSIAQSLVGALTRVQMCQSMFPNSPKEAQGEMEELKKLIIMNIKEVRQIIFNLRPSTLDDLGLIPTLEHFLKKLEAEEKIKTSMQVEGLEKKLPPMIETAIYRIVQEALTNVRKHSKATKVRLKIRTEEGKLYLDISDNGTGFQPEKSSKHRSEGDTVGIIGMKERVALLGGTLNVDTLKNKGSRISIEMPI